MLDALCAARLIRASGFFILVRRVNMKYASLLLVVVATVILNSGNASACFCSPPDFSQSIMDAKAIFSGKVVEVSHEKVVFAVEGVWKGKVEEKITLGMNQSSCTYPFEQGETYLVYALKYKDSDFSEYRLFTNLCTRTRRLGEAKQDIKNLWSLKLHRKKKA
jgi:hypothetical protein